MNGNGHGTVQNGARVQAPAVLIYGSSGHGKTVAALRALTPERTIWISAERGALKPAGSPEMNPWHPRRPREILCVHAATSARDPDVSGEMEAAIADALGLVASGQVTNIVIDTLSSYARRLDYQVRNLLNVGREYGKATDAVASHIRPHMDRIYESVTSVQRPNGVWGATLVALCHERDPFQPAPDKHTRVQAPPVPGGPDLPGYLAKQVRHDFDLVLRTDMRYVAGHGVQRVFAHNSTDKLLPTKDRWAIVSDAGRGQSGLMPLNLGAILRVGMSLDAGRAPPEADVAILRLYDSAAAGPAAAKDLIQV